MSGASTAHKLRRARDRIAELEAEVARLRGQLEGKRDPASTTSGSTTIRSGPREAHGSAQAARPFGFAP